MAEEKMEQAKATFNTLCRALDANEWQYEKNEEALIINCRARGEDLPMEINIRIDAGRMLVMLMSQLPCVAQEDKRLDVAVAVSAVNNRLVDGSFDYNVMSGQMIFRMTNSFIDSVLSEKVFLYMLYCSCSTIDMYNDKFLMLTKGLLSVEKLLESSDN